MTSRGGQEFDIKLIDTVALLPGAGGPMGKEAMAGVREGIRAYHGSPHSFDRFVLSPQTIGTGEGVQAYGHGLYFAGNERTAKGYRDDLTNRRISSAQRSLDAFGGDVDQAIAGLNSEIDRLKNLPNAGNDAARRDSFVAMKQAQIAELNNLRETGRMNTGHMYEVNINASPSQFLDWDKPLAQQSGDVRQALGRVPSIAPEYLASERLTGGQLAPQTMRGVEQMREAGIPGIQYLDAGSRAPMRMASDELPRWEAQKALAEKNLADAMRGGASPRTLAELQGEVARTADGLARTQAHINNATRNYVVFDDSLIDILRKYGLGGAAVLPGAAMLGSGASAPTLGLDQ